MRAYNFGASGHTLTKLYQGMWLIPGVMTWTLILQGVLPKKFGRAKCQKFSTICYNFRL